MLKGNASAVAYPWARILSVVAGSGPVTEKFLAHVTAGVAIVGRTAAIFYSVENPVFCLLSKWSLPGSQTEEREVNPGVILHLFLNTSPFGRSTNTSPFGRLTVKHLIAVKPRCF